MNNKIKFLNNQKNDVETKIEELINILTDDDSNVSRETMSDSIHDNVKLIDFIELDRNVYQEIFMTVLCRILQR